MAQHASRGVYLYAGARRRILDVCARFTAHCRRIAIGDDGERREGDLENRTEQDRGAEGSAQGRHDHSLVPLDCRSNAALVKQSVTCMTGWLASIGK
jgi:hypothetical protein